MYMCMLVKCVGVHVHIYIHVHVHIFLHIQNSSLVDVLRDTLLDSNLRLSNSSDLRDLPPASLQRFLRAKNQSSGGISNFTGYVLATYDQEFTNRCVHVFTIIL